MSLELSGLYPLRALNIRGDFSQISFSFEIRGRWQIKRLQEVIPTSSGTMSKVNKIAFEALDAEARARTG